MRDVVGKMIGYIVCFAISAILISIAVFVVRTTNMDFKRLEDKIQEERDKMMAYHKVEWGNGGAETITVGLDGKYSISNAIESVKIEPLTCGHLLQAKRTVCEYCGCISEKDYGTCDYCGAPLRETKAEEVTTVHTVFGQEYVIEDFIPYTTKPLTRSKYV